MAVIYATLIVKGKKTINDVMELAPMMACIIIAIIPIIILYATCQKYIIEGVVAGAVKG